MKQFKYTDAERFEANMREAEKTMIDLSKNQSFSEPVILWVSEDEIKWRQVEIFCINHTLFSSFVGEDCNYRYASLTSPNKPGVKKHSHNDLIIGASRKGWVFQDSEDDEISTYWSSKYKISRFRVAYKYNGPETVWYDMVAKDA